MPAETLGIVHDVKESTIVSLEAKALVERTHAGNLTVHDLIREYVRRRLDPNHRREMHRYAAHYFVRRADPRDRCEALYHLAQAGLATEAAELLKAAGSSILDSPAGRELPSILKDFDLEALDTASACVLLETAGDGRRVSGEYTLARMEYSGPSIEQ